jgi:hypothetical protein
MEKFSKDVVYMMELLHKVFDQHNKKVQYIQSQCTPEEPGDEQIAYGHELATNHFLFTIEELLKQNAQETAQDTAQD